MEQLILKLDQLVTPKNNIRIHTEKQLKEFERSVEMFGQLRPIVVDEKNTILAGNGLCETMRRMGIQEALVYRFDDLTENQKKKLMIADNRIFSLGVDNIDTLNSFLEELNGDLDIPGFDEEILQQMVADAEEVTEKLSEYGTLDEDEIQKIKQANAKRSLEPEMPSFDSKSQIMPETPPDRTTGESIGVPPVEPVGEEPSADIQRFVVCPKCGEKIWL